MEISKIQVIKTRTLKYKFWKSDFWFTRTHILRADMLSIEQRRRFSMCHFKEIDFWLKIIFVWHKGVLKWSENWPKMIPNAPLPPSPSPTSAKVSCQGANKLEKNALLMIFYHFYEISQKNTQPGGLKRDPREKHKRRFPERIPKRGNPTMTTSTITTSRKGDPQHYVEGING